MKIAWRYGKSTPNSAQVPIEKEIETQKIDLA
jgi:hypothetical protein